MKKNFLTAVAVMVATFFVGTTIAEAAGVTIGGEIRPRWEADSKDFQDDGADDKVTTRVRLNASADILPDTSAFIQVFTARTWDGTNGGLTASDGDSSVGIHQAYFTVKNFFGLPVDAKIGRQEVVLDGHRLIGNTGWAQGATAHDGLKLSHSAGNHTLAYVYSRLADTTDDITDADAHIFWGNFKGVLGGALSAYWVYFDDGRSVASGVRQENSFHTVGARQAGQLAGLDYRAEFYYQFGEAESSAAGIGGAPYATVQGTDRAAYMFGLRVGKKFNNVMWKPKLTLWYDHLSGTSDEDARDGEFNTFNTLFDTGHKFYGLIDLLNTGDSSTASLGLVDYAIKAAVQPADKWTLKADYHYFTTAEGGAGSSQISGATLGASVGNELGQELDLTVVHKYNSNLTVSAGFSQWWSEDLYQSTINSHAEDSAEWAYVMFDVKF